MNITVNNKEREMKEGSTAQDLLHLLGYGTYAAIWINKKQLLQSEYKSTTLKDRDQIKIIRPLGGG